MNKSLLTQTLNSLRLISVMLLSALLLSACGGGGDGIGGTGITPIAKGKLIPSNEQKLAAFFQGAIKRSVSNKSHEQPQVEDANSSDGSTVSSTNLQEAGVDEADLIKTNGRFIYSIKRPVFSPNVTDDGVPGIAIVEDNVGDQSDLIRVMDTQGANGLQEIKRFTSNDQENEAPWHISGLYLHNAEKRLLALSSPNNNYYAKWFDSQFFSNQETKVLFFDITDPAAVKRESTLQFEGQLISSRRNGDTLYLVLRHFPNYQYVNDERLLATQARDFLPRYRVNNQQMGLISKPQDCYLEEGQQGSADIISLVAIDLTTTTPQINSRCYVGSAEAVYASQKAFYLATTRSDYLDEGGIAIYSPVVTTDIHKFNYDGLNFDYRGSGEVDGHLGFKQDSKSFRFSEKGGLLRVVTFDEDQWLALEGEGDDDVQTTSSDTAGNTDAADATSPPAPAKSPVLLTILKEDPTKRALQLVSKLPNAQHPEPIGLPGEQLYATRFIGNRAYVVTFRVTDPLYILDLNDPTDPFIAGELKINGYSDYLHPISENLLLGVGKDAIPAQSGDFGRGAWYQGVKLSLIDVSDPANPREADKVILGKRGTETNVLYDHHAFTSLLVGNQYRVALPVQLHEEDAPVVDGGDIASTFHDYKQTGLYRFEIDINAQKINKVPAMVVADVTNITGRESSIHDDRSVIINDTVYYMHNGQFWIQDWQGADALIGPK